MNVIPIQTGFDRNLIERSDIEGIASFASECVPDRTHTRITRSGDLHIGYWGSSAGRALPVDVDRIVRMLERFDRFQVRRVADVLPYKYAKLMYNAAINPLAAVAGLDNGQLLSHRRARLLFFTLLRENYETLKHARVCLGQVGPFHPDSVN
jgi:2-dehydropantoate 2-reductase